MSCHVGGIEPWSSRNDSPCSWPLSHLFSPLSEIFNTVHSFKGIISDFEIWKIPFLTSVWWTDAFVTMGVVLWRRSEGEGPGPYVMPSLVWPHHPLPYALIAILNSVAARVFLEFVTSFSFFWIQDLTSSFDFLALRSPVIQLTLQLFHSGFMIAGVTCFIDQWVLWTNIELSVDAKWLRGSA